MFLHCYIIFKHRLNTSWKVVPTVLINSFFKWILNSFTMAISFDWKQDMYIYIILWSRHWFSLPEHPSSPPVFCGVCVARSLVLCVMFCRSLFVLLSFFFWPLCCLFFFNLWLLITSLVSSNFSYRHKYIISARGNWCKNFGRIGS